MIEIFSVATKHIFVYVKQYANFIYLHTVFTWHHYINVQESKLNAQRKTFTYPTISKLFLYSKCFMMKSLAQTLPFKARWTKTKNKKHQTFLSLVAYPITMEPTEHIPKILQLTEYDMSHKCWKFCKNCAKVASLWGIYTMNMGKFSDFGVSHHKLHWWDEIWHQWVDLWWITSCQFQFQSHQCTVLSL